MPTLTLFDLDRSGDVTTEALFQTNVVRSANTGDPWFADDAGNPVGTPTGSSHEALAHFGISMIRYPGGSADASFADGMMIDGALPDHVVNILTYASQHGMTVDMVVPVDTPPGMTRAEFLSQMAEFAAEVEARFPGVVAAYELGNEYWNYREAGDDTLEAVYGANAGEVAVALGQGMDAAGADADVFVQASGNPRGAFGNSADLANGAIQAAFGSVAGAMDVLDGVIRNNYWRDPDLDGFENDSGPFAEDRGLGFNLTGDIHAWDAWLGRDLLSMVGEYNINRNIGAGEDSIDMGIHGASYLLEHMTNMIDAGVDIAFAWPIAHNTTNAYLHQDEAITTVTVHGMEIATNTTRAAILDLMRQTIDSHELVHAEWSFGATASDVEVTLFEAVEDGQGERIVFLSSRTDTETTLTVDLSTFIGDYLSVTAVSIFYEDSDGHLRDAVVRELPVIDPDGDAVFTLQLMPYEVVQFVFTLEPEAPVVVAPQPQPQPQPLPDPVAPDPDAGPILGVDVVCAVIEAPSDGGKGDDLLNGGKTHDYLRGAAGNDSIYGEGGNDSLFGDSGHDLLHGGPGWDFLHGGYGRDTLIGGSGNDTLDGGVGDDRLVAGLGADAFVFGPMHGHDKLVDFEVHGGDVIDLSGLDDPLSFAELQVNDPLRGLAVQQGSDVVIMTASDSSVTLHGVMLADLTVDHFVF